MSNLPERRADAPETPERHWAHSEVRGRYPSGTDVRMAMRELMGVFMERADGTNALEWWRLRTWYHGGPRGLKKGEWILPPSETGRIPGLDQTSKFHVYVTSNRADAVRYALRHDRPHLYRVRLGSEPEPDDLLPFEETSKRAKLALIEAEEYISTDELRDGLVMMARTSIDDPPAEVTE